MWPLGLALIVVLAMFLAPGWIVMIAVGMMPAIVAYFIDRTAQKSAALCVGGMNFCGIFPFVLDVPWGAGGWNEAWAILGNVFNPLMMYSAAAFGWLLYMGIPPVVSAFIQVIAERRVAECRDIQAQLVEEWGEDVAAEIEEFAAPSAGEPDQGAPSLAPASPPAASSP